MRAARAAGLVILAAALPWLGGVASGEQSQCGPFGNPPAEVQHGFFATFVSDHNPVCFGGQILGPWKDSSGSERYACLYEPKSAGADNPLPLVVFLHGSIASADSVLATGLRGRTETADLGNAKPGFILLAPEGRETTHYYPGTDAKGLGWDNWYRQLSAAGDVAISGATWKENPDAAAIDHFVDEEVGTGKVDRKRIYVMGWSNGAAMAILYALERPQIAAAAVYSAPDPFGAFDDLCPQTPVAHSPAGIGEIQVLNARLPLMHVRNNCDIGGICPNGDKLANELHAVGVELEDAILDSSGNAVSGCEGSCGTNPMAGGSIGFWGGTRGFKNHVIWPKQWNEKMFDFLKRHPLAGAR